ncbi:MAG TPA: hypothetical protein PK529_11415, partial [Verrucomicrobiales bacterium]|nr:hypothetical protein [Verrucomicrobiales bacterium]
RAALVGLFIIQIEMTCIPFEMARDGYQETRFSNAWGAAGNVAGALTLVIGIWFFPTIEFLLIAVNGSIALAKLGNTCHLLIGRPYLFPRFSLFRKKLVPLLARDGIRFSITYILAAAVEYNLMAFLIGRHVGPEAVGIYNVMITVHFSLTGLVVMFTKPYWPALMDAFERQDTSWITTTSNRLRLGGLLFALLSGIGLVALGPVILPLWAGEEFYTTAGESFKMDRFALICFGAYFTAHIWRHINQILALGIGWISPVARVVVAEAAFLILMTGYALYQDASVSTIYLVMAGSITLFSGWLFPLFFLRGKGNSRHLDQAEMEEALPAPMPPPARLEFKQNEGISPAAELRT